jgi:hypothetical protein
MYPDHIDCMVPVLKPALKNTMLARTLLEELGRNGEIGIPKCYPRLRVSVINARAPCKVSGTVMVRTEPGSDCLLPTGGVPGKAPWTWLSCRLAPSRISVIALVFGRRRKALDLPAELY